MFQTSSSSSSVDESPTTSRGISSSISISSMSSSLELIVDGSVRDPHESLGVRSYGAKSLNFFDFDWSRVDGDVIGEDDDAGTPECVDDDAEETMEEESRIINPWASALNVNC